MTTEQALEILTRVTENISATRLLHAQILQALEVLKKAVK